MNRCFLSFVLALCFSMPLAAAELRDLHKSRDILDRIKQTNASPSSRAFLDHLGLKSAERLESLKHYERRDGRKVTRYRQRFNNVPVFGREVILESDAGGRLENLKGQLVRGLDTDIKSIQPGLAANAVTDRMKSRLASRFAGRKPVFKNTENELVIYVRDDGTPVLSYRVTLLADSENGGHPTRPTYLVDANSGEVLLEYDGLTHADVCSGGCAVLDQSGLSARSGRWIYRTVTIPAISGASTMLASIAQGLGDADLYVRRGANPSTGVFDCSSIAIGNNDSCSVTVSAGETWHIGMYAYRSFSGLSVSANVEAPPSPAVPIGEGPGGNVKTSRYYYNGGSRFPDFPRYSLQSNGTVCTMANENVKTVDLNNGTSGSTAFVFNQDGSGACYNKSREVNGAFSPLNDAHFFGGMVYDMYQEYLGEPPLTFQLMMRVHYGNDYDNAFWDGSAMTFGDGKDYFHPLVSLDVVAHEVSHGFTEQNSDLIYSGESGGINEAFSDIAGEAAEYYMFGDADFLVGADITKSALFLRNMCDPPQDGFSIDHVSEYQSGMDVHYSSGIYNKAFCTLATKKGWDVQKAFVAFANANRYCWIASTGFVSGAQCVVDEAKKLGWSGEDVASAFQVVGITGLDLGYPPETAVVSVGEVTENAITLSWTDVAGESSYQLQRSTNAVNFTNVATLAAGTTGYTDSNLQPQTTYYYRLFAINASGQSQSETVSATTLVATVTIPNAPSGLTATTSSRNSVSIRWLDNANNETSLEVYQSTSTNFSGTPRATLGANATTYTDTGLNRRITYYYRVRACNAAGCSAYSNTTSRSTR